MPRIIAITNQKGGIGKTATTFNLGASLALQGRRVVLVDDDPAGGLTYACGYTLDEVPEDLSTAALWRRQKISLESLSRNLSLCPSAPAAMVALEAEWSQKIPDPRGSLDWLNADVILIDTPPNLGPLAFAALRVSDEILIPAIPEYASLGPFTMLMETIAAVNPDARILGVVPTMVNPQRKMTREVLSIFADKHKMHVFPGIARDVGVAEIPATGKPITETKPKSAVSKAYNAIAEELIAMEVAHAS